MNDRVVLTSKSWNCILPNTPLAFFNENFSAVALGLEIPHAIRARYRGSSRAGHSFSIALNACLSNSSGSGSWKVMALCVSHHWQWPHSCALLRSPAPKCCASVKLKHLGMVTRRMSWWTRLRSFCSRTLSSSKTFPYIRQ